MPKTITRLYNMEKGDERQVQHDVRLEGLTLAVADLNLEEVAASQGMQDSSRCCRGQGNRFPLRAVMQKRSRPADTLILNH